MSSKITAVSMKRWYFSLCRCPVEDLCRVYVSLSNGIISALQWKLFFRGVQGPGGKRCSEAKENEGHATPPLRNQEALGRASGWWTQKPLTISSRSRRYKPNPMSPAKERWTCHLRLTEPLPCFCCWCALLQPLPRSEIIWPLNRVHSTWPQIRRARESRASRPACQVLGWDALLIPSRFWKGFLCIRSTLFLILRGQNCTYGGKEHKKGNKHLMIQ